MSEPKPRVKKSYSHREIVSPSPAVRQSRDAEGQKTMICWFSEAGRALTSGWWRFRVRLHPRPGSGPDLTPVQRRRRRHRGKNSGLSAGFVRPSLGILCYSIPLPVPVPDSYILVSPFCILHGAGLAKRLRRCDYAMWRSMVDLLSHTGRTSSHYANVSNVSFITCRQETTA